MYLLRLSLCVLRHPLDSFRLISADRQRFSFIPAFVLLGLMVAVRLLSIQWTHFALQTTDPHTADWVMEALLVLVPVLSLAIGTFAITSVMDGAMMMRETLTALAYAAMPFIVFTLPITALSHLLGQGSALYVGLQSIVYVWCAVLYIIAVKVMNNYTFARTLGIIVLTILLIALMWAVLLLVYALWNQFKDFLISVYREAVYAFAR